MPSFIDLGPALPEPYGFENIDTARTHDYDCAVLMGVDSRDVSVFGIDVTCSVFDAEKAQLLTRQCPDVHQW